MNPKHIESLKKKILVVYSAGCGNGKSEIAANLAYSIARGGIRTWVLDANTFAPAEDYIFGYTPKGPTFSHFLINPSIHEIPVYPMDMVYSNPQVVPLLLTHAEHRQGLRRARFRMPVQPRDECAVLRHRLGWPSSIHVLQEWHVAIGRHGLLYRPNDLLFTNSECGPCSRPWRRRLYLRPNN